MWEVEKSFFGYTRLIHQPRLGPPGNQEDARIRTPRLCQILTGYYVTNEQAENVNKINKLYTEWLKSHYLLQNLLEKTVQNTIKM